MLGFVVAMDKEAGLFLSKTKDTTMLAIAGKKVYKGVFEGEEFVLIIAGIGKVNASLSTQLLIDKFNPKVVVNFGVAGGKANSGFNVGDVVIIDKACQYDFDLSEIDDVSVGYMQDYDTIYYATAHQMYAGNSFKKGSCASGDRFTKKEYFLNVISELSANVVDMECGAIAQVCTANKIPFISLKLISDVDGVEGSIFEQYSSNVKTVCDKIPNAVKELILNLK